MSADALILLFLPVALFNSNTTLKPYGCRRWISVSEVILPIRQVKDVLHVSWSLIQDHVFLNYYLRQRKQLWIFVQDSYRSYEKPFSSSCKKRGLLEQNRIVLLFSKTFKKTWESYILSHQYNQSINDVRKPICIVFSMYQLFTTLVNVYVIIFGFLAVFSFQ